MNKNGRNMTFMIYLMTAMAFFRCTKLSTRISKNALKFIAKL